MKNNIIYSFDIFDTCFIRACYSPKNIFDLLAYRILGDESEESIRMDFAAIRIEGEKKARALSKKEEVTLSEIYDYCNFEGLTDISNKEIAKVEIEIEREQLSPVYSIREKTKELHRKGKVIYYISDMYLPQDFIEDLLIKNGFWQSGDKLYVSSTYGKTKQTGSLYEYIAEKNRLSFKKWYHYGDNKHSDFIIPKRLGIKANLIKHKDSIYEDYLKKEFTFPGYFINEHLAGISKAIRYRFPQNPQIAFAADLIAPLYIPFVYKVLLDARRKNIKRLFFLARDGYILYHVANELKIEFPDIEIKYLYVSRSSLYLPGLNNITSEISSLLDTDFGFKNEDKIDILKNFISPVTIEKIRQIALNNRDGDIFKDKNVLNEIIKYHNEQRNLILKYFIQEGLADNTLKTAIVDIRGTRTCQQAINNILVYGNYNPIIGYYLEVINKRKSIKYAGTYKAFYYSERMDYVPGLKYISTEMPCILEQYFSASPHKRTISYYEHNGKVLPFFEENENESVMNVLVECHEKILSKYTHLFVTNKLNLHVDYTFICSTNLLGYFMQRPKYYYLKALYRVKVNNKKNDYKYIIGKLTFSNIKYKKIRWLRGSLYFTIKTTFGYQYINILFTYLIKIKKKILSPFFMGKTATRKFL